MPNRLYPYQQEFVNRVRSEPRRWFWILGDEMGLGKTAQALEVTRGMANVLIICPEPTLGSWSRECERWLSRAPHLLTNADSLPARGVNIAPWSMVAKLALRLRNVLWNAVVVDECHWAKNPDAKRTRAVFGSWGVQTNHVRRPGIIDSADKVLCLTGTPVPNRPRELRSVIGAMSLRYHTEFTDRARTAVKWGSRYCNGHLADIHTTFSGVRRIYDDSGSSNLSELNRYLQDHGMVRRTKADVLPDLPPLRMQVVPIMSADVPSMPVEWGEQVVAAILGKGTIPPFDQISEYRLQLALAKVPAVVEYTREILDETYGESLVVFCHHREVAEKISDSLCKDGVVSGCIYGSTPVRIRNEYVTAFRKRKVRVLVTTIGTMGTGIDGLQEVADTCVVAELPWVPAQLQQAIGRLHRIGQQSCVLAHLLVAPDTMDAYIVDTLLAKTSVIDQILTD